MLRLNRYSNCICYKTIEGSKDLDYRKISENLVVDNIMWYNDKGYRNATLNGTMAKLVTNLDGVLDYYVYPTQICFGDEITCANWQPNHTLLDVKYVC